MSALLERTRALCVLLGELMWALCNRLSSLGSSVIYQGDKTGLGTRQDPSLDTWL